MQEEQPYCVYTITVPASVLWTQATNRSGIWLNLLDDGTVRWQVAPTGDGSES